MDRPSAAVAYIERQDGKILVVWNKRYGRWAMPGGKVEDGERVDAAVVREVYEETGLGITSMTTLYAGEHGESVENTRGSYVHVFACKVLGKPEECEPGCPVTWFTHEEFLKWGLAPAFYKAVFDAMNTMIPESNLTTIDAARAARKLAEDERDTARQESLAMGEAMVGIQDRLDLAQNLLAGLLREVSYVSKGPVHRAALEWVKEQSAALRERAGVE